MRRLVDRVRVREQSRWDEQMDQDSIAGKLDFLFRETDLERLSGKTDANEESAEFERSQLAHGDSKGWKFSRAELHERK